MSTILWLFVSLFAQSIVILYPPVIVFWLIIHSNISYWRRIGKKRAYWLVCMAWPILSIPLLVFRSTLFERAFRPSVWLVAAGLVAFILAIRFARQAARIISVRTLIGLSELEPHKNVQPVLDTGVYSQTRNPVYVAHWLVLFAAAAMSGYWANWILVAADTLLLPLMVRAEEKELLDRYGVGYETYMRRVPRFMPRWPW